MVHRPTDPRSPIQSQRNNGCLPFILAGLAALAFWTWQNSQSAFDWAEDRLPRTSEASQSAAGREQPQTDDTEMKRPSEATDLPPGSSRARANLVQLFSTDDYPMEAIRNNEQGTVAFELSINRLGGVSGCRIVQSSGSKSLDEQTCNILRDRARFAPARDATGKRITDQYRGRIRWELPEE